MIFIVEGGGVSIEVGVPLFIVSPPADGPGGGGPGAPGASAYEVAVAAGFEGTVEEWLASLIGADGASAYQLAVDRGFVGTVTEWLASLIGPPGASAYQLAVAAGFGGDQAAWLASLQGASNTLEVVTTQAAFDAAVSSPTHWVVRVSGA